MSSIVDTNITGSASTTRLPVINDSGSLVSPLSSSRTPSVTEQLKTWALEVRQRLDRQQLTPNDVGEIEIDDDDVTILKTELVSMAIRALQKDDHNSWMAFREAVLITEPYGDLLKGKAEIRHYIERISDHLERHKERLFDAQVMEALERVFPQDSQYVLSAGTKPANAYCQPSPPPRSLPPASPRKQPVKFRLPDGKNPYQLEQQGDKSSQKPKGLTIGDLRKSIPDVAFEMVTREAIWSSCLGNTAQALLCDLPDMPEEDRGESASRTSSQMSKESAMDAKQEDEVQETDRQSEGSESMGQKPMNGREAVEYFSKCYHTGKIKFMYFNIAPSVRYRPYDLVDVVKEKADPEHYVFSTFGVLHAYPDQPSENLSLADWQKEAVLFNATLQIPFFRNYLLRKMFDRWKTNVHYSHFAKIRHDVSAQILPSVPNFGAALLQVSKLCQELLYLRFLPLEYSKCYELGQFENVVNYMKLQAEKVLDRFFRYNKLVVSATSEETFKKLKHCEEQCRHKSVFSKESLYIQRMKKEQREENLKLAKTEAAQLGNFVKLVDQMLLAYLVKVAIQCVTQFVHETLEMGPDAPRDGFFTAKLVFGKEETLTISPRKEKFERALNKTLGEIPVLLCEAAVTLDGSMQPANLVGPEELRDMEFSPLSVNTKSGSRLTQNQKSIKEDKDDIRKSVTSRRSMVTFGPVSVTEVAEPDNVTNSEMLQTPDLSLKGIPSKSKDNLGQATPSMVEASVHSHQDTVIKGSGIVGQSKPLTKGNLEEKLKEDEAYKAAMTVQQKMLGDAISEIDEYCHRNAWLNEIFLFCNNWFTGETVLKWRGSSGFLIEQKLSEIRQWTEKVRQYDLNYITDNGLFYLDCSGVPGYLVPKLNEIYEELCSFVVDEALGLAKKFCTEMKETLENMRNKQTDIGGFADYAKNVAQYKRNQRVFQERMEYIKSLFEVIRMSYRQLEPHEEKLEENVLAMWDTFLVSVQDAMDFVNVQTPLITQNLEDIYQKLEAQAKVLFAEATTGKYLDPEQEAVKILMDMYKIRDQFFNIESQMLQASKWKEAITTEPYNLKFLHQMGSQMNIRQELWMYLEVSTQAVREWKTMLFRKLNCRKCLDKLQEWQGAAGQMKKHLPAGDEVLAHWFRILNEFKQDLPLLHKLSNDALKPRHWKSIFLGMGEPYDPKHEFSVEELLAYNLGSHAQIITTIYSAAVSEFTIEKKLVKIRKLWQEREFKLAKHIPDSLFKGEANKQRQAPPSRKAKKFKKVVAVDKDQGASQGKTLELYAEHLFVLIEAEELQYWLEDSRVTLQGMLQSPFLADHRTEAEYWYTSVSHIEEILDLWMTCQSKWLYLLRVFDDPEMFRKMERQSIKFQDLHLHLVEFMQAVTADPRVTAMLAKQRGDRAWRQHQGDKLMEMLRGWINMEEEILLHLNFTIDRARTQFPRLYFLSNDEMVQLLGIARNPQALMPFAKKCFKGIVSVTYDLPPGTTSINPALDFALNADKLEVVKVTGLMGEELVLYSRLKAIPHSAKWLLMLEHYMKTTMLTLMEACIEARLEEGSQQPVQLLEELSKYEAMKSNEDAKVDEILAEIHHSFNHWILRFPAQCVLTAEAVMWERLIYKALEKQDTDELRLQKRFLQSRIEQYIKVLRENCLTFMHSDMRQRLHYILGNLVNQGLYHRDVMERLLKNPDISDGAFDWMKVMRYHMEIRSILQLERKDFQDNLNITNPDPQNKEEDEGGKKERRTSVVRPVTQSRLDDRGGAGMKRSYTGITTGYQFGQCMVSQMGATFAYDHEYLGPTPRLIFTPLTERAYLTLTLAMSSFACGTLIGPSGTGKSETIKDLAKAMGRDMTCFNCNEELTLTKLNQFLSGSIQSGTWAIFDDTDRMTKGLMSVFAQQLEYIGSAMRVLDSSSDNQYGIRGQPKYDKMNVNVKHGDKRIRRNSLTTLHSLPTTDQNDLPLPPMRLKKKQATVPHGFNEEGLSTYFEESWVKERERRHSIEKEIEIKESELYKSIRPPPLFYEHVTWRRQPKRNFDDLVPDYVPYKPRYIGNVLFNGKLIKANANYGCFMTMNTVNRDIRHIPENIKMCMRTCALVIPERKMVIQATLYSNGFQKHKLYADKLNMFLDLITTQLPRHELYDFGLKTLRVVMTQACEKLHSFMDHQHRNLISRQKRANTTFELKQILESPELEECEMVSIITALKSVLLPKMTCFDDSNTLENIIKDIFPSNTRPRSGIDAYSPKLVKAIQDQMTQNNLQANDAFILKVLSLYTAMELKQGIILAGMSGSGKTTLYKILSEVLTKLHTKEEKVDDELIPETSLAFQYNQKLKILKEAEPLEESTSKQGQALWGKFKKLSSFGITLQNMVEEKEDPVYPKVDLDIVYPNAFTPKELFGYFQENQIWKRGILGNIIRISHTRVGAANFAKVAFADRKNKLGLEKPDNIEQWVVLDGSLNPVWVDSMNTLLDNERKLSTANGDAIELKDGIRVLFELSDLSHASPCTVNRCAIINCPEELVGWRSLVDSWTAIAKQRWVINQLSLQVMQGLVNSTFQKTINFLNQECTPSGMQNLTSSEKAQARIASGIKEISSFLNILSSLLDRHLLREELEKAQESESKNNTPEPTAAPGTADSGTRRVGTSHSSNKGSEQGSAPSRSDRMSSVAKLEDSIPNYMAMVKALFAFAYVWGFGGNLDDRSTTKFDEFARDTLRQATQAIYMPLDGTVYDYMVDVKTGIFIKWSDRPMEKPRSSPVHYSVIPQIQCYSYMSDLLLSNQRPVLIIGDPGVGKSALVDHMVVTKHPYTQIIMSPGLTTQHLQHQLTHRLTDIKANSYDLLAQGPKVQRELERHLFFIDDLNVSKSDGVTGSMPSVELVRQILNEKKVYDLDKNNVVEMAECNFVAAATSPGMLGTGHGYACNVLSGRLLRLFTTIAMCNTNEEYIHSVYTPIMQRWLEEFPTKAVEHHTEFAKAIVQGLIEIYSSVQDKLRPTPTQAHYIFTMHDIGRVLNGMLLMSPRSKIKPKKRGKDIPQSRQSDIRSITTAQSLAFSSHMNSTVGSAMGSVNSAMGMSAPAVGLSSGVGSAIGIGSAMGSFRNESTPPGPASISMLVEEKTILPMMRVIARLWCHEITRTFGDRIVQDDDCRWFENLLEETVIKNFCSGAGEWDDKMSTIPEDIQSLRTTPSGLVIRDLLKAGAVTPAPSSVLGSDMLDDDTQTVGSVNTALGLSKENTFISEQPTTPRSEGVLTAHTEVPAAPSPNKDNKEKLDTSEESVQEGEEESDEDEEEDSDVTESSSDESDEDYESTVASRPSTTDGKATTEQTATEGGKKSDEPSPRQPSPPKEPKPASGTRRASKTTQDSSTESPLEYTTEGSDLSDSQQLTDGRSRSPTSQGSRRDVGLKKRGSKAGGGGPKRGVHFKAGLIADKVVEKYTGPLMSLEQIKEYGEKLTDFIFTKYITTMHAQALGGHAEKGYTEIYEDHLTEALYTCCREYNKFVHQRIDMVFFREAARHTARLSRVLATMGGHAVLLGLSYCTGRATLARLAAHFANAKLYEPKIQVEGQDNRSIVREHLKRLSKSAAFHGKAVVLLLREEMGEECIEDVCAFMKEGACPGLYTDEEIQDIATQMNPGQVRTTRVDKIEQMYDKFTGRVKQNLHVIFSMSYSEAAMGKTTTSLQSKLLRNPTLMTGICHVDIYRPWNHEAYVTIADAWLRDPSDMIPVPWSEHSRDEQINLVATAMSYIHSSSKVSIEKLYSHQRTHYKFFTPLTYMEFIHIFKIVGAYISKEEREKIQRYNSGLAKMNEAFDSIASFKKDMSDLIPKKNAAISAVQEHIENVEKQRQDYIRALERCKEVEATIENMMSPLEKLRVEAEAEFDRVNPTYHAALRALQSLNIHDVNEVKTFNSPPSGVVLVMNAICLLFKEEETWERGKALLMRDNFFEELEFYDKANIPEPIFIKLKEYIMNPDLQVELVMKCSKAAGGLCKWLHAVYWYSEISRKMKPKISELLEAEEDLNKAQAMLGAKRVEANKIKGKLEAEIRHHKEAITRQKQIEKQIQFIEKKIGKANHLMGNMEMQHDLWRSELRQAKGKIKTAPGDALLTAACICYHGPLDNRTRADLMHDWLNRCDLGNFDPSVRWGKQVKPVSLSAKLESLMRPTAFSGTESVHSIITQAESYTGGDGYSTKADDSMSEAGGERPSTAMSMRSVYRHNPSVYDTSVMYKTELRTAEQMEGLQHADLESVDASSTSFRNLLAVRENYTLQDVLSTFEELSDWKLKNLPTDVHSIHNGLIMRVCCHNRKHCWPLLVDPDNRAEMWVVALQESANIIRDEEISNQHLLAKLGMIKEEDEDRPLSARSEAFTEFDETHSAIHSATISLYSSRATTRQSHHRPVYTRYSNLSSEDYRPVTSIAYSNEELAGKIDESIEKPENNLWIVEADDPELEKCLLNAIVHGVTVLVTHIERKQLDPLFRGLLTKQFTVDEKGQKIIKVGEMEFAYHPEFCLYLSTSSTLFLKGDGMSDLPVEKTCVIDMATSQEGVIDKLMDEIMAVERPEFEGQKKSIESDLLHHQHELNREHEIVLEKTLYLTCPLLQEKTMLEALINCQKNVERNKMILEETQYLRQHLEEKRLNYNPVAGHGAKLFEIVQRCCVLNPVYHTPFESFLKLFTKTIKSRNRGKGSTGHPKARAQELINATTEAVYKYISLMMFESHTLLFSLLVTLERLRMEQKLTNQELGLFVNGVDTSEIEDNIVFDDKPVWVTNKVWLDCAALETTLTPFKGLRDSFKKYSTQWQEYFKCSFVLMNSLPGERLSGLTVFQKCLLWRICAAQKMVEVSEALVLHELGGIISQQENYSVKDVYEISNLSTPILCVLPASLYSSHDTDSYKGFQYSAPVYEIMQYSKDVGMENKVHTVTCGVKGQSHEVTHVIEDAMASGYWIIVQNAHLGEPWTEELLGILKKITAARPPSDNKDEDFDDAATGITDAASVYTRASAKTVDEDPIHKDFRLWVIASSDEGRLVPGMLIQYGLKMTCEMTSNLKSLLSKSYVTIDNLFATKKKYDRSLECIRKCYGPTNHKVPLAVLHSLLLFRRIYNRAAYAEDNYWSHMDLSLLIAQFKMVIALSNSTRGVTEMSELIYGGHCTDIQDRRVVEALTEAILVSPTQLTQLHDDLPGVRNLLERLIPKQNAPFLSRLEEIAEVNADTVNLPSTADTEYHSQQSRNLVADLVRVVGAPDLLTPSVELTHRKAELALCEVKNILESMPAVPDTTADVFYPMDMFYHAEATIFKQTLAKIKSDTDLLLLTARGLVTPTPDIQAMLVDLSQKRVPVSWQTQSYPSCVPLAKWFAQFKERVEHLSSYMEQKDAVAVFNMAVFHRPDRFIQAVLQNFSRKQFKDLQTLKLDVQFLPANMTPSSPPKSGVYIEGLWLNNAAWNTSRSVLKDCDPGRERFNSMPVIWLKPTTIAEYERSHSEAKYQYYECPIYFSPGTRCLTWTNIIASLDLPTIERPKIWAERRVYLTYALRKMTSM